MKVSFGENVRPVLDPLDLLSEDYFSDPATRCHIGFCTDVLPCGTESDRRVCHLDTESGLNPSAFPHLFCFVGVCQERDL